MSENIFTLSSDDLPDDTHVVGFKGKEGLSEIYGFEIGLLTSDTSFAQDDAVMSPATLTFNLGEDADPYVFHGMLAAVELLHTFDDSSLFRALLVPKLFQLKLTRHSNVWVDMKIPDIIKEVLEWSGLGSDEFELRLDGSYEPMEFVAQYKESNYAFISRWMEREGMFFFFEQGDSKEKLVIVDGKSHDDGSATAVRYSPLSEGDHMAIEAFESFRCKTNAMPASVEMLDYDYLNPSLEVKGESPVFSDGVGEISMFGDNFLTPSEGKRLATIRAEEFLARQKEINARGRVFHLRSGYAFKLEEHPASTLNDKTYLATHISHYGNQSADSPQIRQLLGLDLDQEYICDVKAIFSDVQYRSPDRFPWPRIEGYECATVCGEADSKFAQIDEHGRYRVRVFFDESDLGDGKASAWVRMQQPYGGGHEGSHFPLVKGTEVLLYFMGGDPDRPVIAGAAPNAQKPSNVTVNNHTQWIITTIEDNRIWIEDNSGQMFMYFYCPIETTYIHMGVELEGFNLIINTEGHAHFHIGGDQVIDVDLTLIETVELDVTFNYNLNWLVNVVVDTNIEIGNELNIHVCADVNYNFDANWTCVILVDTDIDIGGVWVTHVSGNVDFTFDTDWNITIGAAVTWITSGDITIIGTSNRLTLLTGDETNIFIGAETNLSLSGQTNLIVGDRVTTITGTDTTTVLSPKSWFTVGNEAKGVLGNFFDMTLGNKLEIKVGNFIELALANKLGLHVGGEIAIAAALKLELTAGARITMDGSIRVAVDAGLELDNVASLRLAIQAIAIHL